MPDTALAALRRVVQERERLAVLEANYVAQARAEGRTWREIGDALGMARQHAHRKFSPAKSLDAVRRVP